MSEPTLKVAVECPKCGGTGKVRPIKDYPPVKCSHCDGIGFVWGNKTVGELHETLYAIFGE